MKIDLNTILIGIVLIGMTFNLFKDPVEVSPYTEEDIERMERHAQREAQMTALKALVELDEQIIKEDEKIIDSTVNFVAIHYIDKRDSLRAVVFGQ